MTTVVFVNATIGFSENLILVITVSRSHITQSSENLHDNSKTNISNNLKFKYIVRIHHYWSLAHQVPLNCFLIAVD